MVYIIQAEGVEAKKLIKIAEKNKDLKLSKVIMVTKNRWLVASLKRHYDGIIVLEGDLKL